MPYCPKCGSEIEEGVAFCPKCGAPIKAEAEETPRERRREYREYRRKEKEEKNEKGEKEEKGEKHEKREYSFVGPLVGGLILIFLGLAAYSAIAWGIDSRFMVAILLVFIGLVIIVGGIYAATIARRRHPRVD
jgi:uncharacterized membrane protein